jgi:hypothetical protein
LDDAVRVTMRDGLIETHRPDGDSWIVTRATASATETVALGGARTMAPTSSPASAPPPTREPLVIPRLSSAPLAVGELTGRRAPSPLQIRLSRAQYRRSEEDWREAGAPEALISLGATGDELFIEVSVRKSGLSFAPAGVENPLDNEHPDVNSDGLQLHASVSDAAGRRTFSWLVVPEEGGSVRVTSRAGDSPAVAGSWRPTRQGYQVLLRVARAGVASTTTAPLWLDVVVNEMGAGRERRRGQLALCAGPGEWVYLRGDRSDPRHHVAFRVADA